MPSLEPIAAATGTVSPLLGPGHLLLGHRVPEGKEEGNGLGAAGSDQMRDDADSEQAMEWVTHRQTATMLRM